LRETSAPISQALNNLELFDASLDEFKKEPIKETSKISAPLNTFLFVNENLPDKPKGFTLEWVISELTPKEYFLKGVKNMRASKDWSLFSL